ncbi:hypothetical protein FD41_GL001190 [Lentilactobacillus farraginis DSM 18382 = JCM 14108]|uniref:Uncharacterized protein n=1 Tax=Lentilactobacillus farraginis DSM 18382 = JCM 14108 TaxID=1423743 RepID=A0A0R1W1H8_9LACO|nr:hypothetical protein FD41_GL001190 [Lentilactobacillus farraginis DSM 18382 = JCM 14108]
MSICSERLCNFSIIILVPFLAHKYACSGSTSSLACNKDINERLLTLSVPAVFTELGSLRTYMPRPCSILIIFRFSRDFKASRIVVMLTPKSLANCFIVGNLCPGFQNPLNIFACNLSIVCWYTDVFPIFYFPHFQSCLNKILLQKENNGQFIKGHCIRLHF